MHREWTDQNIIFSEDQNIVLQNLQKEIDNITNKNNHNDVKKRSYKGEQILERVQ